MVDTLFLKLLCFKSWMWLWFSKELAPKAKQYHSMYIILFVDSSSGEKSQRYLVPCEML